MTVIIPQTRDIYGDITSSELDINLAPSSRQLDIGLDYAFEISETSNIRLGAAYILNAGNNSDVQSIELAASYSFAF